MAEKGKGSIVYELLIVILGVLLVASILYPKMLKEKEQEYIDMGRWRMDQILKAELQYQKYNGHYSDSLQVVLDFLKTSDAFAHDVDSVIVGGIDSIITRLNEFETTEKQILSMIPMAEDTTIIDSIVNVQQKMKADARQLAGFVEYIHDRTKNIPNTPIDDLTAAYKTIDSKQFTIDMSVVINSTQNGSLEDATKGAQGVINIIDEVVGKLRVVLEKIPQYRGDGLDSLYYDPFTHKPFVLVNNDTSTIKYLNIYCPIDSLDIENVKRDFLKSKIGGFAIENYGKIENGEKSWEAK